MKRPAPTGRGGRRHRSLLVALPVVLLVAALALVARGGTSLDAEPALAWGPSAIERSLEQRLTDSRLSVRWVQCVTPRDGASFHRGTKVLRCAANFGAPHMPVYCATIVDGELVTDRQVRGLRC